MPHSIALIWNWKTRGTVAPLIYVLARYMPIVQNIFQVFTIFPMSLLSCKVVARIAFVAATLSLFVPSVFSAIRTYALSGKNLYLAAIAFLLSIAPNVVNLLTVFKFQTVHMLPSPFNCSIIDQISQQLGYKLTMTTRACVMSADLLVVVVTWMYTYKSYKIQKGLKFGSSLAGIMLLDGSIYFVILASLNILQMVFKALQIDSVDLNAGSFITILIDPVSYILVCHFLLSLRQVDRKAADPSLPSNQDGNLSVQFARQPMSATLPSFIASFGEPVCVGSAVDPDLDFEGDSQTPYGMVALSSMEA